MLDLEAHKAVCAAEMARILGVSKSALDKQRSVSPEKGPPFVRFGRRVLYPITGPNSYSAWLASNIEGGGSANA